MRAVAHSAMETKVDRRGADYGGVVAPVLWERSKKEHPSFYYIEEGAVFINGEQGDECIARAGQFVVMTAETEGRGFNSFDEALAYLLLLVSSYHRTTASTGTGGGNDGGSP